MKKKSKNRPGPLYRRLEDSSPEQAAPAMRLTPVKIGIGLAVVLLGGTALVTLSSNSSPAKPIAVRPFNDGMLSRALADNPAPDPSGSTSGSLAPPAPGTRVPINDTDPFTGKPITASSPTLPYKGYEIGFCCTNSEGYRGAWNRMSESDKDAFVRSYLK
jgi:hypothetical protein